MTQLAWQDQGAASGRLAHACLCKYKTTTNSTGPHLADRLQHVHQRRLELPQTRAAAAAAAVGSAAAAAWRAAASGGAAARRDGGAQEGRQVRDEAGRYGGGAEEGRGHQVQHQLGVMSVVQRHVSERCVACLHSAQLARMAAEAAGTEGSPVAHLQLLQLQRAARRRPLAPAPAAATARRRRQLCADLLARGVHC